MLKTWYHRSSWSSHLGRQGGPSSPIWAACQQVFYILVEIIVVIGTLNNWHEKTLIFDMYIFKPTSNISSNHVDGLSVVSFNTDRSAVVMSWNHARSIVPVILKSSQSVTALKIYLRTKEKYVYSCLNQSLDYPSHVFRHLSYSLQSVRVTWSAHKRYSPSSLN